MYPACFQLKSPDINPVAGDQWAPVARDKVLSVLLRLQKLI